MVTIAPSPRTRADSVAKAAEDERKARLDNQQVRSNLILSVVAALQLLVFGWQAIMLGKSVKATRNMAKGQSEDTQRSIQVAERAANAATEANTLTRDFFIAAERPWLDVTLEAAGPLNWNAAGWTLRVQFTLKNVGRSPAGRAKIQAEPFDGIGRNLLAEQRRIAQHVAAPITATIGFNVFPGQSVSATLAWTVPPSTESSGSRSMLVVAGCVDYNYPGVRDHLRTDFIFVLHQIDRQSGLAGQTIARTSSEIPHADLRFLPWIEAGDVR